MIISQYVSLFLTLWLTVVSIQHEKGYAYCTASTYIDQDPEIVWAVLTDPYKFQGKRHIKKIEVLENRTDYQKLQYTIEVFFPIPDFTLTVESELSPNHDHITFQRTSGALRDLKGYWKLTRQGNGTVVEYAMYLDTGFFIPQWIVDKAQQKTVPDTLEDFKRKAEEYEIK